MYHRPAPWSWSSVYTTLPHFISRCSHVYLLSHWWSIVCTCSTMHMAFFTSQSSLRSLNHVFLLPHYLANVSIVLLYTWMWSRSPTSMLILCSLRSHLHYMLLQGNNCCTATDMLFTTMLICYFAKSMHYWKHVIWLWQLYLGTHY